VTELLLPVALALLAGVALGLFYFGGLWLTVQRVTTSQRPELLTLGSFVLRMAVTLAGFYWVMDGRWERLVACLAGFFVMRSLLVRRWKPQPAGAGEGG
jgi:F1F0 ATPase subunit 2